MSREANPISVALHQNHQDTIYVALRANESVVLGLLRVALVASVLSGLIYDVGRGLIYDVGHWASAW